MKRLVFNAYSELLNGLSHLHSSIDVCSPDAREALKERIAHREMLLAMTVSVLERPESKIVDAPEVSDIQVEPCPMLPIFEETKGWSKKGCPLLTQTS
ncbi:hypothetical protein [Beijerinckia indica]|uniref:Uncharacterized protein n=1 Tax=Beijerinckia indica subsp. indica (strain ATCC 9039 / DSM 1715 / NCIMB 8712) TaxID=395963 RepID=B2IC58_BEII9|nr:hypothetical protein [Beijerinckia indica]ACB96655.1 hypothetical protein Bind_3094 [Beijerinckia indica subsp. indica ATCC 9039]